MALQAGASGVAFTPVPGLIGSDLLRIRPDFRVIDDPYRPGETVVLVPAIAPDFALVHGRRADPEGNVVIGTGKDDRLLVQAARRVIVSVEQVSPEATMALAPDEQLIPAAYVERLVVAPSSCSEADSVRAYLAERAAAALQA